MGGGRRTGFESDRFVIRITCLEGRDINTQDAVVRYLGIFLGCTEAVAKEWGKRITTKMRKRFDRWLARGAPGTR